MRLALYDQLVSWYHLLDPIEDHADEAERYREILFDALAMGGRRPTLLELGAGAGNNASFLKHHFDCTLTDLSPAMVELSTASNPTCEHVVGDMRSLRLGRTFDAVLIHDAVVYMATEDDLRAALATAFAHTRPGGVALFAPDCLRETFVERSVLYEGNEGERALRCIEWSWDPDPSDSSYVVEYAFLLRDGAQVEAVHDRHVEGLFSRREWEQVAGDVGFTVRWAERPLGDTDDTSFTEEILVGHRPDRPTHP